MMRVGLYNRRGSLCKEFDLADKEAVACLIVQWQGKWFAFRPPAAFFRRDYHETSVYTIADDAEPCVMEVEAI